jgi:hypothetical protein
MPLLCPGNDQNSIQNRVGNLYELTALCFIGMLSSIAIYPAERNIFYREFLDNCYPALAFFAAYFLLTLPIVALAAVAISLLMTCAVGLKCSLEANYYFTFVVFCFLFVGECLGVLFCSLFYHVGFSVNVMSVIISLFCE